MLFTKLKTKIFRFSNLSPRRICFSLQSQLFEDSRASQHRVRIATESATGVLRPHPFENDILVSFSASTLSSVVSLSILYPSKVNRLDSKDMEVGSPSLLSLSLSDGDSILLLFFKIETIRPVSIGSAFEASFEFSCALLGDVLFESVQGEPSSMLLISLISICFSVLEVGEVP